MADNTLRIAINADIKGLNQNLNKAQTRLKAFSGRLKNIGGQLQTRLALPLIAAGGASIKMAADFDKSMTKIKTLVGVAGAEVDQMSMGVKAMATAAGVSSGEAADALFFITSAGLRGSDAMAVLEQSTKAAALGLGDTATVADLATSALNAYGVENLSAVDATDVLTAAVREGKLEASELSSVMGQVLPVASNMGVQFHEVGAAFAAMSRTGTNASQAATQLNSILTGIMKPTKDAEEAMLALGTSKEKLRKQIKEEGLLSVFQTLKQASETNSAAFERVFGNVRALRGILDLTGKSAATTAEIFNRMSNTTGITSRAFDELQKSSEFRLRKGLKALQNSFTDLGAELMSSLLPVFQNILGTVTKLFKAFGRLSPQTKQIAIGFAALAVVLPTVLSVGGAVLGVISAMISPIGLVALAVAGLVLYFDDIANAFVMFKNAVKYNVLAVLIRINEFFEKYLFRPLRTASKLFNQFLEDGFGADFGGIMDDFFKEGDDISKEAGKKLAENYVKEWEQNSKERFDGSLRKFGSYLKSKTSDMLGDIGIAAPSGVSTPKGPAKSPFDAARMPAVSAAVLTTSESFGKLNEQIKNSQTFGEKLGAFFMQFEPQVNYLAQAVGGTLMSAFQALGQGGNFFDTLIQGLKRLVIQLAAAAAAAFVLTIFLPSLPGLSKLNLGSFKGVFAGLSGLPKFANGGIVSGPTLGLMGEYSGARSNPEVIAPLDKLKGMIGQQAQTVNVGGKFRLEGQDLVVALQRADKNRSRLL